jgi:hypothetical protein
MTKNQKHYEKNNVCHMNKINIKTRNYNEWLLTLQRTITKCDILYYFILFVSRQWTNNWLDNNENSLKIDSFIIIDMSQSNYFFYN